MASLDRRVEDKPLQRRCEEVDVLTAEDEPLQRRCEEVDLLTADHKPLRRSEDVILSNRRKQSVSSAPGVSIKVLPYQLEMTRGLFFVLALPFFVLYPKPLMNPTKTYEKGRKSCVTQKGHGPRTKKRAPGQDNPPIPSALSSRY